MAEIIYNTKERGSGRERGEDIEVRLGLQAEKKGPDAVFILRKIKDRKTLRTSSQVLTFKYGTML